MKRGVSVSWQNPINSKLSILVLVIFVTGIIILGQWFIKEYVKLESAQEMRADQIDKLMKSEG